MRKKESLQRKKKRERPRPVLTHHISSFGLLNRNGLEIPSGLEADAVEEEEIRKNAEFAAWTMPEQRPGFIQVRKHDFF